MGLDVGSRLDHYDVTGKLGEGGMGEVWEATDTKLNRQVALKMFTGDPDRLGSVCRRAKFSGAETSKQLNSGTRPAGGLRCPR